LRTLILASSSPYRRAILDKIGLAYQPISPQIDENPIQGEKAGTLVQRLALEKAQKIATDQHDALIIGSDQVAILGDTILSKPLTVTKAEQQLALCSGECVSFHTGLCLLDSSDSSFQLEEVIFKVHFRELTDSEIRRYIAIEQPLDCAGSFKVEGLGISLFERLQGDDFNSLIGLPLIRLLAMLSNKGISPLH